MDALIRDMEALKIFVSGRPDRRDNDGSIQRPWGQPPHGQDPSVQYNAQGNIFNLNVGNVRNGYRGDNRGDYRGGDSRCHYC